MKVITLLNEKGGVGKTTLALHIAGGLAIRGKRVLLIDADPQGHSTVQMGLEKFGGFYRAIIQGEPWKKLLKKPNADVWAGKHETAGGQLLVLPGNIETRAIPMLTAKSGVLRDRLAELERFTDAVVIDTSPTPSMLQAMICVATTHLLYPSQCQYLSLDGLAESHSHMNELNSNRADYGLNDVAFAGVVPTMYEAKTNAHKYGLELIKKKFGERVFPTIPKSSVFRDREYARKLLFAYAPDHEATYQLWNLINRLEAVCHAQ